jgi:hypothetical protein
MFDLPPKCARCGSPLKKQVIGSNNFYYCRKCGCTSSVASVSFSSQPAVQKILSI